MAQADVASHLRELGDLLAFLTPDENAASLLARCFVPPLPTGVPCLDRGALRPGHVLEAVGGSGCGKTALLVAAAATCCLPEAAGGVRYGGAGGALPVAARGAAPAARRGARAGLPGAP